MKSSQHPTSRTSRSCETYQNVKGIESESTWVWQSQAKNIKDKEDCRKPPVIKDKEVTLKEQQTDSH